MDYYELLGLSRECTSDELHRAFRQLSKQHHPDRVPSAQREEAEKKYKRYVKAFNTLKNPRLKERYDRGLPRISSSSRNGNSVVRKPAPMEASEPQPHAATVQSAGIQAEKFGAASPTFSRNRSSRGADASDQTLQLHQLQMAAVARVKQGDYQGAAKLYEKALKIRESADLWRMKGLVERKMPDGLKRAASSLNRAIQLGPEEVKNYDAFISVLIDLSFENRARQALAKALKLFPQDSRLFPHYERLYPDQVKKAGKGGLLGNIFGKK
jgi:curved DNA-binding protein CbpA